jgi:hypothetical protein
MSERGLAFNGKRDPAFRHLNCFPAAKAFRWRSSVARPSISAKSCAA